jgi:hypothetical protein
MLYYRQGYSKRKVIVMLEKIKEKKRIIIVLMAIILLAMLILAFRLVWQQHEEKMLKESHQELVKLLDEKYIPQIQKDYKHWGYVVEKITYKITLQKNRTSNYFAWITLECDCVNIEDDSEPDYYYLRRDIEDAIPANIELDNGVSIGTMYYGSNTLTIKANGKILSLPEGIQYEKELKKMRKDITKTGLIALALFFVPLLVALIIALIPRRDPIKDFFNDIKNLMDNKNFYLNKYRDDV